ncbi:MAG: uracil-DNA glycosylase [Candidatus Aenigmatarchaeota archaeon]
MNKEKILDEIAEEIKNCKVCRKNKFGLAVPGKGNPNSKIVFIGEAPGYQESKKGEPFVGLSGKFLDSLFKLIGIKREEVFITSPVKYYPGRRAPTKEEIKHGMNHTSKQIEVINPKLIVMLGNVALMALFPNENLKISEVHGKVIKRNGRVYFPTFHPSAARRFPKIREEMIKDFKKLRKLLKNL